MEDPADSTPNPLQVEPEADFDKRQSSGVWPKLRRLVIFQVKLYIDALRDLLMSPLSFVAFLVDAIQGNQGDKAMFEALLKFGRRTEQAINLFEQHDINDEEYRGIDTILLQVEEALRREYADGSVSGSARESIEKSLGRLRNKIQNTERSD